MDTKTQKQIPYAKQWIDDEDTACVEQALKGEWITRGPEVASFEQEIAERVQARYAVAFNSATNALSAAYYAADVGEGDRILTSPNTFVGTVSGAIQKGAKVDFIDIDPETGLMDINLLQHEMNFPSTRSKEIIVPVHLSRSIDMSSIASSVVRLDTIIIEDAAQALGSYDPQGNPVGACAFSDMTVFSFHPAKMITTGEGGMVTTNDSELYHKLQLFRNNGIERDTTRLIGDEAPWYYEVVSFTGNHHMHDFQAALGRSQLRKIDKFIEIREKLRARYLKELEGVKFLQSLVGAPHTAYYLFVVRIDFEQAKISRQDMMLALGEKGVGTQVHYIPLYRHPVFGASHESNFSTSYPGAELYYKTALTLPLHCHMDEEDVVMICDEIKALITR